MRIAAPAETDPGETRVAATPETVKKFVGLGAEVAVEMAQAPKRGFQTLNITRRAPSSSLPRKRSAPMWC